MNSRWTKEEDDYLRITYPTENTRAIAAKLKRTKQALNRRASELGIRKKNYPTRFVKFDPKYSAPVGTTRTEHSGYIIAKTESGEWKHLHRLNWEKANGKIPPGKSIGFRDGNRANCEIGNLFLTSPKELMEANTFRNLPEELQQLMRAKSSLTYMINKRSKPK